MRPSEVVVALGKASEVQLPVMLWGSPGVGKSSVVKQVGASRGRQVYDIRLALLDPTDLRGLPYYNLDTKKAEWAVTSILPQDPDSDAIVFLDEINAAPPSVQAAAYQLVLDRAVGEYRLPEKCSIVAAGNREGDKAVTFRMPTPLLNRFIHIDFEFEFEDWHVWAVKKGIEADVVGFLNFRKHLANQFDASSRSRGFPTPRSWEYVSKILDRSLPDSVMRSMIAGTIGEGAMVEFMAYREVYLKLPDPEEVLDGKIKEMPRGSNNLSQHYAMIISLSYALRDRYTKAGNKPTEAWIKAGQTYLEFLHASFSPEFCVMGVRDCLRTQNLPLSKVPGWRTWARDYAHFVLPA